jgi:hypothetical protein
MTMDKHNFSAICSNNEGNIQLDPFLWSSYEYLCELGGADDVDPTSVFGVNAPAFHTESESDNAPSIKPLQDRSMLTPSFAMSTETPAAGSG